MGRAEGGGQGITRSLAIEGTTHWTDAQSCFGPYYCKRELNARSCKTTAERQAFCRARPVTAKPLLDHYYHCRPLPLRAPPGLIQCSSTGISSPLSDPTHVPQSAHGPFLKKVRETSQHISIDAVCGCVSIAPLPSFFTASHPMPCILHSYPHFIISYPFRDATLVTSRSDSP